MDFGILTQHLLTLTGSFNLWLILALFFLPLIGEFGFSLPYALESVWLLAGYHVSIGSTAPIFLVICCVITLAGRQTGAFALYKISGLGSAPFTRFYDRIDRFKKDPGQSVGRFKKYILFPLANLVVKNFTPHSKGEYTRSNNKNSLTVKMPHLSSFRVALGRFIWLKIPLTITTGITRQLTILVLGVALFSLVYDSLYILMGVFGAGKGLSPFNMMLYMFGGFIFVNLLIILVKRYVNSKHLVQSA